MLGVGVHRLHRDWACRGPRCSHLPGAGIAFIPWTPDPALDPELALALFVAPVLLDAGVRDQPARSAAELAPGWRTRPRRGRPDSVRRHGGSAMPGAVVPLGGGARRHRCAAGRRGRDAAPGTRARWRDLGIMLARILATIGRMRDETAAVVLSFEHNGVGDPLTPSTCPPDVNTGRVRDHARP